MVGSTDIPVVALNLKPSISINISIFFPNYLTTRDRQDIFFNNTGVGGRFIIGGHWNGGAWILMGVLLVEFVVSIQEIRSGSIPQKGGNHMVTKLNTCFSRVLAFAKLKLSGWVVRSMLLLLGIWDSFPQPNVRQTLPFKLRKN